MRRFASALVAVAAAATLSPAAHADDQVTTEACGWVHPDEAAVFLDGPATAEPIRTQLPELSCAYRAFDEPLGRRSLESDVRFADAFPWDAATTFRQVAEWPRATAVDGVGVKAVCTYEPNVTPPSTTLTVLLTGERIYRVTGSYVWRCETLKTFAELAIARIGR
ncbi:MULTISPECIES: hypothetical protein [Mycobacteriaceae]|uniref:DUF3558 domain-containing protein n=2 Tax=Mycobacteriaceae TaxID=1762 RepID=A0A8H2JAH8_MYCMU|nr:MULTISPECIES: hypothetical protein [Mycobacteriaceae]KAB7754261.1 hypothetical protein MMUC44124_23085 [Mycolicibacterium mucogenicum DSM 44124]QPG70877.1 hypothetical protein C1S78_007985 [Mycolicibacterium mucogenicum DSM 44124]SEB04738.1 hypothetical protein SAMN04488580_106238 [Mycobacterium sp. 283mftsu]